MFIRSHLPIGDFTLFSLAALVAQLSGSFDDEEYKETGTVLGVCPNYVLIHKSSTIKHSIFFLSFVELS